MGGQLSCTSNRYVEKDSHQGPYSEKQASPEGLATESDDENSHPWRFWRKFSLRRGDKGKRDTLHRQELEQYEKNTKLFPDDECKRTNSLKPPPKPPRLFLFRSSSISTPRSSVVGPSDRNSFIMSQAYQSSRARDSNVPTAHVVPIQKENSFSQTKVVNNNNVAIDKCIVSDEQSLSADIDKVVLSSYSSSKIKIVTPDLNPRRTIGRSRKMSVDVSSSEAHRLVIQNASELLCQTLDPTSFLDELSEKGVISKLDFQAFKGHPDRRLICESLMHSLMEGTPSQFITFCDILKTKETYQELVVILDVMKETYDVIFNIPVTGVCSTQIPDEDKSVTFEIGYYNSQLGKLKPLVQLEKARDYKRYSRDSLLFKRSSRISYMSTSSDKTLLDEVAGQEQGIPMINIHISGYSLKGERAKAVAAVVEKNDCILELHVGKTQMLGVDVGSIAVALPRSKSLSVLDLRLNSIGNEGANLLSCFLQKNTSIQILNLSSTGMDSDGLKSICEALKFSSTIHELDLSFLDVSDNGCISVCNMLKQNKSLTKLRLRSANISWIGCGILFEGVQQSKTLTELDMSRNFIGDDGIEMICRHLNEKTNLLDLNLENCGITASGCSMLADVILGNKTIKNLDLSSNFIADTGITKLAAALERNKTIKTLGLNMCGITNDGFSKLLDVLECNPTITMMKLCYNRLGREYTNPAAASDDLRYRVRIVTSSSPKLKLLLWGNAFDDG